MRRQLPGPGQESVWDYPRPPRVEPEPRRVVVEHSGALIVDSVNALRVLETSHPPGIYVPPADVQQGVLAASPRTSFCEWKGAATYWDIHSAGAVVEAAAWSYPKPSRGFESLTGYVSFYPGRVDACFLDDERVSPQEGDFYGGWITAEIIGPFKGGAGTWGW